MVGPTGRRRLKPLLLALRQPLLPPPLPLLLALLLAALEALPGVAATRLPPVQEPRGVLPGCGVLTLALVLALVLALALAVALALALALALLLALLPLEPRRRPGGLR